MGSHLKQFTCSRSFWFLVLFSALLFEGVALYFQYVMNLSPCVMCVYERVALFSIAAAALFGFLAPSWTLWRWLALLAGLVAAVKGLLISLKHVDYQLHPGPWNQCESLPQFPDFLPLDHLFPALFRPYGVCSDVVWSFLDLSMAQWIAVMFGIYVAIFVVAILIQFFRTKPKRFLFH